MDYYYVDLFQVNYPRLYQRHHYYQKSYLIDITYSLYWCKWFQCQFLYPLQSVQHLRLQIDQSSLLYLQILRLQTNTVINLIIACFFSKNTYLMSYAFPFAIIRPMLAFILPVRSLKLGFEDTENPAGLLCSLKLSTCYFLILYL